MTYITGDKTLLTPITPTPVVGIQWIWKKKLQNLLFYLRPEEI